MVPNELGFIRRAAAWWIKLVGLNRWVQREAVWNLNSAERAQVCRDARAKPGSGSAWGARLDPSGPLAMRFTMAEGWSAVNAAGMDEGDRDRRLGARLAGGAQKAIQWATRHPQAD